LRTSSIGIWWKSSGRRPCDAPYADRQYRDDQQHDEGVGEPAVAFLDQADEPDRAGRVDGDHHHRDGERWAHRARHRLTAFLVDFCHTLIDRVQDRYAGVDQREQHCELERILEPGRADFAEQEGRGQRDVRDLAGVADHRDVEHEARQHAERAAEQSCDHRFASPRQMTDAEEHRRYCGNVVARVGDAGFEPAVSDGLAGEGRFDAIAERDEAPDEKHDVDEVEIADRQRQEFLDRGAAVEHHRAGRDDHADRADELRQAEQVVSDLAGGGAHDGEHDDDQQEVGDLEQEPAGPEQQLEERAVVVGLRHARQLEADHQHGAPEQHGDDHAEQAAPRPGR